MNLYKCLGKTKIAVIWTAVLGCLGMLLIYSEECKNGAINGIIMCIGVLIPSLFPFLILASFISESHIIDLIAPVFNPISKILLGLRGICFAPVFMSLVGGYPVGAKTIATLYKNKSVSNDEVQRLSAICCFSGPGFLITFVGVSLLKSKESGIILLVSQIISSALLCVISRLIYGKISESSLSSVPIKTSISESLVSSVFSAVKSTAGMCGYVIAFSVICNALTETLGADNIFGKAVVAILEITTGVNLMASEVSLEVISALTSFGGFCVHLQIFRELKGLPYSKVKFYIFRLLQSAICLVSTKLLLLVFPVTDTVFSTIAEKPELNLYSNIAGITALLITSIVFIVSIRNKRVS